MEIENRYNEAFGYGVVYRARIRVRALTMLQFFSVTLFVQTLWHFVLLSQDVW